MNDNELPGTRLHRTGCWAVSVPLPADEIPTPPEVLQAALATYREQHGREPAIILAPAALVRMLQAGCPVTVGVGVALVDMLELYNVAPDGALDEALAIRKENELKQERWNVNRLF